MNAAAIPMRLSSMPLLLLCPMLSGSIESRDLRGLAVLLEPIDRPVIVDGVAIQVQRAEGRDVEELAQRVLRRWKEEGAIIRALQQPGWQVRARWDSGRSELIQWRGAPRAGELLHSTLDVAQPLRDPSPPPFRLPPVCRWGRTIEGQTASMRYAQHTALCRSAPAHMPGRLRDALASQGWIVTRESHSELDLRRDSVHGLLRITVGASPDTTALVWIGEEHR